MISSTPIKNTPLKNRDPEGLLIAIPTKELMRWQTLFALLRMHGLAGYNVEVIPFGGADVAHSRNIAFHYWRTRSTAMRLLFLDSDLDFRRNPRAVEALLDQDHPVIAGLYPLEDVTLRWSFQGKVAWDRAVPEHLLVEEVCTGMLLLRYDVLVDLLCAEDQFEFEDAEYRGETGYAICQMPVVDRRRYPEDFFLSRRIQRLGYEIRVDTRCWSDHVKCHGLLLGFSEDSIRKNLLALG